MNNNVLYLDCPSGISGDMLVGALAGVGVPESVFRDAVEALGLPGVTLDFRNESRQGISGIKFRVLVNGRSVGEARQEAGKESAPHHHHEQGHHSQSLGHEHSREHGHHHQPHVHGRTHRAIRELIGSAHGLHEQVRARALAVFHRIATAEGKIHGISPDDVHFHEVGGEDSIADIVCACAGLHALAPKRILCSRLFEGTGSITCAHGSYPLPAPATAEILRGIPLRQVERPFEFITPTGAALAAEFTAEFAPMPELTISSIGYGLGTKDPPHFPNILRAILATSPNPLPNQTRDNITGNTDQVVLAEANLDDCTPEVAADACRHLLSSGALDCWLTPIIMKKGRPGFLLSALFTEKHTDHIIEQIFKHTTTFGIRLTNHQRMIQTRRFIKVSLPEGDIRVKIGEWRGQVMTVSPEYEDCRELAERSGVSARVLMDRARELASGEIESGTVSPQ